MRLLKALAQILQLNGYPFINLIWEKHYHSGKLPNLMNKGSF